MEPGEIRRERLRRICDAAPFKGNQTKLADAISRAPNLVSRMLLGKGFGERMARHIEASLGLEPYALDKPLESTATQSAQVVVPVTAALLIEQMRGPLTPLGIRLEDVADLDALATKLNQALGNTPKASRSGNFKSGKKPASPRHKSGR